jgi:signal transduction histidine kinase
MFHTLRFRLLLTLILVMAATVGIIVLASTQITTQLFARYEEHQGLVSHQYLEMLLGQYYGYYGSWSGVRPTVEQIAQSAEKRMVLADADGLIVADSENTLTGRRVPEDWGTPAVTVTHQGTVVGRLYTDTSTSAVGDRLFLNPVSRFVVMITMVSGLCAVLLIVTLSRRALAPVETLTAAARRMEAGDLSQRVEVTSQDEIGDLARAFNAMADGLARLEELRRNMVNDVAHELRTPLSNIRGYLEALQDGVVEPDARTIDSLYEEAMLLSRLVDDLQELSLAEAGQLRLERQPVVLADVVDRAVDAARPRAESKGVTLRVEMPESIPLANIDPHRIGQVLRNLLDNGLTHTPAGGEISVTAHAAGQWIAVSVRDTGAGIAEKDLPYIFERFYRADKSRSRATGGAGLGLAIVKQLVKAHGGRVEAESQVGRGTTFTFTLPVEDVLA